MNRDISAGGTDVSPNMWMRRKSIQRYKIVFACYLYSSFDYAIFYPVVKVPLWVKEWVSL